MAHFIPDDLKPIYLELLDKSQAIEICVNEDNGDETRTIIINHLRNINKYNNSVNQNKLRESIQNAYTFITNKYNSYSFDIKREINEFILDRKVDTLLSSQIEELSHQIRGMRDDLEGMKNNKNVTEGNDINIIDNHINSRKKKRNKNESGINITNDNINPIADDIVLDNYIRIRVKKNDNYETIKTIIEWLNNNIDVRIRSPDIAKTLGIPYEAPRDFNRMSYIMTSLYDLNAIQHTGSKKKRMYWAPRKIEIID